MILAVGKLQLTGQNLGRVFNFRYGRVHAVHFICNGVKLHNLKLKTRPKQLLDYLPLDIALPLLADLFSVNNIMPGWNFSHYIASYAGPYKVAKLILGKMINLKKVKLPKKLY
jgi:hypothetical protein